jgi:hypothetical protein
MAPSSNDRNLEAILVSNLVRAGNNGTLKHKLFQLSLYTYLSRQESIERVEMEYPLRYFGPRHLDYSRWRRQQKNGYKKQAKWPVDLAVIYQEGSRRICEFIEVETINIIEFWKRLEAIGFKTRKVEKVYEDRRLNELLENVDEVRFSVALNASGLSDAAVDNLAGEFRRKYIEWLRGKTNISLHKIYLIRGNVYDYCPQDVNLTMLKDLGRGYGFDTDSWRSPLREVLSVAYSNIIHSDPRKLSGLFSIRPLV